MALKTPAESDQVAFDAEVALVTARGDAERDASWAAIRAGLGDVSATLNPSQLRVARLIHDGGFENGRGVGMTWAAEQCGRTGRVSES
jgi:hypothetical protein